MEDFNHSYRQSELSFGQLGHLKELSFENCRKKNDVGEEGNSQTRQKKRNKTESNEIKENFFVGNNSM